VKQRIEDLIASPFARDAFLLMLMNVASRGLGFVGTAYAARCLGPAYLGISAVIQTTAQQVSLLHNGGFDTVAVRKIASNRETSHSTIAVIVLFRVCVACFLCAVWLIVSIAVVPADRRSAWLMGIPLIMTAAATIPFAFQGLEKLPVLSAIAGVGAIVSTAIYFLLFSPGMFLGADLMVSAVVGALTVVLSWFAYRRIVHHWPIQRSHFSQLMSLLRESKRYWILAVLVYFYSVFQFTLVAHYVGDRDAGLFRSAFLMVSGVWLLFDSINSLLLPRLVAWRRLGLALMWQRQAQLLIRFSLFGVPLVVMLMIAAPFLFQALLGPAFMGAVRAFQIMVLGRLVVFVGQIYAFGLAATEEDGHFLMASFLGAFVNIAFNIALLPRYGILAAAYVSVISEIVVCGYCYLVSRHRWISAVRTP